MKYGCFAFKGGDREEYKSIFKVETSAAEWPFERTREAFEKVAKDEAHRTRTCVEEHRFPAAYHRADKEVSLCRICAQIVTVSLGGQHVAGFSWKEALQLVVRNLRRKNYEWRAPSRSLVVQTGACSKRMRYRKVCVKT